jgi:hypothetical protein
MNHFAERRATLIDKAKAVAPRNPNACIVCANLMLSAVSRDAWERVPMCRHFQDEDRGLQSRQALIGVGVVDAANAHRVLRCVYCYGDGRDCFQVSSMAWQTTCLL